MRRLLLLIVLLATTAQVAAAQDLRSHALEQRLRSTAQREAAAAHAWARTHSLPLALTAGRRRAALVALRGDRPVYLTTTNAEAAALTHTDRLYPGGGLGLALTGTGMKLGIWDYGGVDPQHRELEGRVVRLDAAHTGDHATHVGGTLVASGLLAEARGMAYEAELRSYDWNADLAEMAEEARQGLLVSNHSYSLVTGWTYGDYEGEGAGWYWLGDTNVSRDEDYLFGRYDFEAVAVDEVTQAYPYLLPVFAAGNERSDDGPSSGTYRLLTREGFVTRDVADGRPPPDGGADGYDTISGAAVAKNVLTVGSVGPEANGTLRASSFSSFGPLDDGRIKPDLVGGGERLFSTLPGSNDYGRLSGTSMATPNVAGSLVLLQQYHQQLHARWLRAASLRAIAVHTARDLAAPGPDYRTGWGVLDAAAAAMQIARTREDPLAVMEASLDQGSAHHELAQVEAAGPLRITLAWNDPPSTRRTPAEAGLNDRRSHLVHDLDLRLTHLPTGEVYRPYVLDPEERARAAAPGDNRVDTIEQIYLAAAPPGLYAIDVTHKDSLQDDAQPFTLVVTGAREATRPLVVASFELRPAEDHVLLTWRTQLENQVATFTLERAVLPAGDTNAGLAFIPVDSVQSTLAEGGTTYTYDHRHVLAGRYRYRLRVHAGAYDEVVATRDVFVTPPRQQSVVAVYPQPARSHVILVVDLPALDDVRVDVYDVTGRRVASQPLGELRAGRHHLPLDVSQWAAGIYVARLSSADGRATRPFVVTR